MDDWDGGTEHRQEARREPRQRRRDGHWERWEVRQVYQSPPPNPGAAAGCGAAIAAFIAIQAVFAMGDHGFALFPVFFMLLPVIFVLRAVAAANQVAQRTQAANPQPATEARPDRATQERAALQAAAVNDGWVTPALVVMNCPGLTLAEARELLESLQGEGLCSVETDDSGREYFQFPLGGKPEPGEEALTPDEWVRVHSRRMGLDDEPPQRVDA